MLRILQRCVKSLAGIIALAYIGLVVYAYLPGPEQSRYELATDSDQFITIDGQDIRYREYGRSEPNKPSLILLHGFGYSLESWQQLAPLLATRFHVITLDLVGFGLSSKPSDYDYSNAHHARTVSEFIRAQGINRFIIGGHSFGGNVAIRVSIANRAATGLLLLNPGIVSNGVPAFFEYIGDVFPASRATAQQFGNRTFRTAILKGSFVNPALVDERRMDGVMLASRTQNYTPAMAEIMATFDGVLGEVELLRDIGVPTLLIIGTEDKASRGISIAQAEALIADSKLVLVEAAGHFVHEEQTQTVADQIIRQLVFLNGTAVNEEI